MDRNQIAGNQVPVPESLTGFIPLSQVDMW